MAREFVGHVTIPMKWGAPLRPRVKQTTAGGTPALAANPQSGPGDQHQMAARLAALLRGGTSGEGRWSGPSWGYWIRGQQPPRRAGPRFERRRQLGVRWTGARRTRPSTVPKPVTGPVRPTAVWRIVTARGRRGCGYVALATSAA